LTVARFGAHGVVLDASVGEEINIGVVAPLLRLAKGATSLFNLSAALIIEPAPSGLVPGGKVNNRSIEVQQRQWRRTRSLFKFPVRVLFRKKEDLVVISGYFGFLSVTCTHQLK
jgi:hypothetical protein